MTFELISDTIAQGLALASCGAIFWRTEPVLNRMCCSTFRRIYAAFYLLVVGSFALAFWILAGYVPAWPTVVLVTGIALLLICERRVKVFIRLPKVPRGGIS